jgi:hypothetical protein
MRKFTALAVFTSLTVSTFAQRDPVTQYWAGQTAATPPYLSGNTMNFYATGQLWKTDANVNVYFKAVASVDGQQVWSNAAGKGISLPLGWPGYVFNYSFPVVLTPGVHQVSWLGTIQKGGEGPDILWAYTINVIVP